MKVERDYLWKRYTFIPETKDDEKFLEVFNKYIDKLEEENKQLKEKVEKMEKADKEFLELMRNYCKSKAKEE